MQPFKYKDLSWQERKEVRSKYAAYQGGNCHFCGEHLTELPSSKVMSKRINWTLFPPNFLKYPIHLHHCHKTGMTIGAVHAQCNAYLWQYHGE